MLISHVPKCALFNEMHDGKQLLRFLSPVPLLSLSMSLFLASTASLSPKPIPLPYTWYHMSP